MLPVNLPPLILLHASTLVSIGAYMFIQPAGPSRENQLRATLGSASISLGLVYLMTSYVPIAENQFLHASVPLRLLTSVLLGVKSWSERRTMSEEGKREFLWVCLRGLLAEVEGCWAGRSWGWKDFVIESRTGLPIPSVGDANFHAL
jgi:hypothetical protein